MILAFLVAPIGLVLGIVALVGIRKRSERGAGLAIAGIVVGSVGTLVVVGAVLLLTFAAPALNTGNVEAQIGRATEEAVGTAPSSVQCPDSVAVQAGLEFPCTAVVDGQRINFRVLQKDDRGNVDFRPSGWMPTASAEKILDDEIGRGLPVTTECADGKAVVVGGPGTTFECTTSPEAAPSASVRTRVTITSDTGDIKYEFVG